MPNYSALLQQAVWQPLTERAVPTQIYPWLVLSTSLTTQLKQTFGDINVEVKAEYWTENLNVSEQAFLAQAPVRFWCREVFLMQQHRSLIFARTLIPDTLLQQHQELQHLGNRALGEWLFMRKDRLRKKLEWTQDPQSTLYARRALMHIGQESMMVAELFLTPQIFTREIK